jgi:N-acetylmuramoyl-L-alanine amidase
MKIVISSGHGKYIRGAEGPAPWGLDEVDEARRVVEETAKALRAFGVDTTTYHDDVSNDQDENLKRIVDFHNGRTRDLDVSVHFNSATFGGSDQTSDPVGSEVFYTSNTGKEIAIDVVNGICTASGLKNRGAKNDDTIGGLYFLSNTEEPAVLLEICFVNSRADCDIFRAKFSEICSAIAVALSGEDVAPGPTPPDPPPIGELFTARGTCSWFGGPEDTGVSASEGLAFIYDYMEKPELFLPYQPSGTSGLARRLNSEVHFVACRWDYSVTSKTMLRDSGQVALVRALKNDLELTAIPADWGPHEEETGRAADLSLSLMRDLQLETDDEVEVIYPYVE